MTIAHVKANLLRGANPDLTLATAVASAVQSGQAYWPQIALEFSQGVHQIQPFYDLRGMMG